MTPTQALDTVAGSLASGPDAAIAAPLVSALRVMLARCEAGTASQPMNVPNLTAHKPREAVETTAPDALTAQIASLRRDVARAVSRGDHHHAQAIGAQLAGLERQLAATTAA